MSVEEEAGYLKEAIEYIQTTITNDEVLAKYTRGNISYLIEQQRKKDLWKNTDKRELFTSCLIDEVPGTFHVRSTVADWDGFDPYNEKDMAELKSKVIEPGYSTEALDGIQKTGIILEMYESKIKCNPGTAWIDIDGTGKKVRVDFPACTYEELKKILYGKELLEHFGNKKWNFVVYNSAMTDTQKGKVMRVIDQGVKMKDEEIWNTFSSPIIPSISNYLFSDSLNLILKEKTIFNACELTSNHLKRYSTQGHVIWTSNKFLNVKYHGYAFDKMITNTLVEKNLEGHALMSPKIVEEEMGKISIMYSNLYQILRESKLLGDIKDPASLNLFVDWYLLQETKYGLYGKGWKVRNPIFGKAMAIAIENLKTRDISPGAKTSPWASLLGRHLPKEIEAKVGMLMNEIETIPNHGFIILNKRRVPTNAQKKKQWEKQNKSCYIDGEPLPWEEAASGHVYAHSNGTEKENTDLTPEFRVMSRQYNNMQYTEDLESFKKRMLADKKKREGKKIKKKAA